MQYIPDNLSEYESAARDVPDCLQEVQRLLDGRWKLAAFQRYRISGNCLLPAQREAIQPLVVPQVAEHRFDGGEALAVAGLTYSRQSRSMLRLLTTP